MDIDVLLNEGVLRPERLDPTQHADIRVFKSRPVREIKTNV